MDVNVALIPQSPLRERIAELSARLVAVGNSLVLDPRAGPSPHVTLYLTGFEEDTVATIPKLIQGNITHIAAPGMRVSGASVSSQGTVLLNVEKTAALDHLHRWMIHKLNPFRMRARPQIWEERRARYGPVELDFLDRLGFPYAQDSWSPHFTIGKVDPQRGREAVALIEAAGVAGIQGMAACIGVGTVGAHGAFTSLRGECAFA